MNYRAEIERLKTENSSLKQQLDRFKVQLAPKSHANKSDNKLPGPEAHVSIVVVGASGDLAKKKTFPSLFALYGLGLLPENFTVFGFARSPLSDADYKKLVSSSFKGWEDKKAAFLSKCFYVSGQYNSVDSFKKLSTEMEKKEKDYKEAHRVFYFAIPPSIFVEVSTCVKQAALAKKGWSRLIVEKPFGKDSQTSAELSHALSELFEEEQLYRIDHYLGKEMVQNLMSVRFANTVFEPIWNRHHVANVTITFKEDIGTEGRGGYFDSFGIIRDVMQNHLIQILALVAMEHPVSLDAEDVRDEKVKVLRSVRPIVANDIVIGQYGKDESGKKDSYLDDPTVPKGSLAPTFAAAVLHIDNSRWNGVPFILKCGKALNERKAEIRIQFKANPVALFGDASRNELVIRVQPNEAVYLKFNAKKPGLNSDTVTTELNLSYQSRYDVRLPDAYERLIYDVLRGDHNLFVRVDELEAAWAIFTPILHKLEGEKIKPEIYPFGSRGPTSADALTSRYGFERNEGYVWTEKSKI